VLHSSPMCLNYPNFKSLSWKVYSSKLDSWIFYFIKKIINNKYLFKSLTRQKKINLCQNGKGITIIDKRNPFNVVWTKTLKYNNTLNYYCTNEGSRHLWHVDLLIIIDNYQLFLPQNSLFGILIWWTSKLKIS
jgi:hypothetical protein